MINFTDSPEFMSALESALLVAIDRVDLARKAQPTDPENTWLTTREARDYLRMSESAFKRLKKQHPEKLVVSVALGTTEPRYQYAALQRLMKQDAVGLPGTAPAFRVVG